MSILKKPYEISVWDDIWDPDDKQFIEQRICTIGTHNMESQARVFDPVLTRNANGVKKFSFKMYHTYTDRITGEKTRNPFTDLLVAERKVKLKYGKYEDSDGEVHDCWYDFIIKNIQENSADYLYTYQLEDALVQELSRNGYSITLDEQLGNNVGTAEELGRRVLAGSGWEVANESETMVEKVNENLIYLKVKSGTTITGVNQIKDQNPDDLVNGIESTSANSIPEGSIVLAFYSSCTSQPYRFQFIYKPNTAGVKDGKGVYGDSSNAVYGPALKRAEDRTILEENCQYYIDKPTYSKDGDYYLPSGFVRLTAGEIVSNLRGDSEISYWYKGDRYGFGQESVYSPVLDKYLQVYTAPSSYQYSYINKDNESITTSDYYGYIAPKTISPVLLQNFVTNSDIEGTSGWIGGTTSSTGKRTEVEAVFGRFDRTAGKFVSATEDMLNGTFSTNLADKAYKSYLKVTFYDASGILLNSGPYDFRTSIGNITKDDKWAYYCCVQKEDGTEAFAFERTEEELAAGLTNELSTFIQEVNYNTTNGTQNKLEGSTKLKLKLESFDANETKIDAKYKLCTVDGTTDPYTNDTFKKNSKLKIGWTCSGAASTGTTYYFSGLEFFKLILNKAGDEYLRPLTSYANNEEPEKIEAEVKKEYRYFTMDQLLGKTPVASEDELVFKDMLDSLSYSTYTPKMKTNGEKTRAVSVKESNYFNNLQSIAEKFEAWLELRVTRDSFGSITGKQVLFKNYAGKDNYATFKYGVNLKDIQRTHESKSIVTKLIVKPNNNSLAENGFCTIQRAENNPTGENYLYNFEYYHKIGLMDEKKYQDTVLGPNNHFSKIKEYNNKLIPLNEQATLLRKEILELSGEKEVYKEQKEAASSAIEEADDLVSNSYGCSSSGLTSLAEYSKEGNNELIELKFKKDNEQDSGYFYWSAPSGLLGTGVSSNDVTDYSAVKSGNYEGTTVSWSSPVDGAQVPDSTRYATARVWRQVKNPAWITKLTRCYFTSDIYCSECLKSEWEQMTALDKQKLNPFYIYIVKENANDARGLGCLYYDPAAENSPLYSNDKWTYMTAEDWFDTKYNINKESKVDRDQDWFNKLMDDEDTSVQFYKLDRKTVYVVRGASGAPLWYIGYTQDWWGSNPLAYFKLFLSQPRYRIKHDLGSLVAWSEYPNRESADPYYYFIDKNKKYYSYNQTGKVWEESEYSGSQSLDITVTPKVQLGAQKFTTKAVSKKTVTFPAQPEPFVWVSQNTLDSTKDSSDDVVTLESWPEDKSTLEFTKIYKVVTTGDSPTTTLYQASFNEGQYVDVTFDIDPITDLLNQKDIQSLLDEYTVYASEKYQAEQKYNTVVSTLSAKEAQLANVESQINAWKQLKESENLEFFTKYSRFIQEGTWMDEKYVDDNLYYIDAQSVMYESCYPKVGYSINVIALESLPEFSMYEFEVGDKTYVEDKEFFGADYREEVVITEITDHLDDPSKKNIKVQNFKNQFQDLFQRITATVQQAEYRSGAYEKAVKTVTGEPVAKQQFLTDALDNATTKLMVAGQQSVVQDASGITVTEIDKPSNSIRLIGGAMLLSKQDENGETQWTTGVTSNGISASLITAGVLNAGEVKIMSGRDPVFRWDDKGITAYDKVGDIVNTGKFVRFDKFGFYGVDDGFDGSAYTPESISKVQEDATFALTWDGLKVTGQDGTVLHLGRKGNHLLEVVDSSGNTVLGVDDIGSVTLKGDLDSSVTIGGQRVDEMISSQVAKVEASALEASTKIDKVSQQFKDLKGEMIPMSLYPDGIIIDGDESTTGADANDKSKITCQTSTDADTGATTITKIFYYGKTDGVYNTTVSETTYPGTSIFDTKKIYYFKPLKVYWKYEDSTWKEYTNIDDVATSYTGIIDKATDTEAILGTLVGYNNTTDDGKSSTLSGILQKASAQQAELNGFVEYTKHPMRAINLWPREDEADLRDKSLMYYSITETTDEKTGEVTSTTTYHYCTTETAESWLTSTSLPMSTAGTPLEHIVGCTWLNKNDNKYYRYDATSKAWDEVTDTTITATAAAGLFVTANENRSKIQMLAKKTNENLSSAIAGVETTAENDRATAQMFASYITGGKCETLDSWPEDKTSLKRTIVYLVTSVNNNKRINTYYYDSTPDEETVTWTGATKPEDAGLNVSTAGFMLEAINGQTRASLNANKISFQTSSFKVCDEGDSGNVIFEAGGVKNKDETYSHYVSLAGWSVTPTSITKETLGSTNGFHMYSSGYTTTDASSNNKYFGQSDDKTWMLGVGSGFGVTSDGEVYATAGQIGNINIGTTNIASESYASTQATTAVSNLEIGGRNLLKGSSAYDSSNKFSLTPDSADTYVYLDGDNNTNKIVANLVNGQKYTISCTTDGIWSKHSVASQTSAANDKHCTLWIAPNKNKDVDKHKVFESETYTETGTKSWTFICTETAEYTVRVNTYGEGNSTVSFWNFKIEKGDKATDWTPAPEDIDALIEDTKTTINTNIQNYLFAGGETTITDDMIISPVIGGGYLHIANETEGKVCSVTIDPKLKHTQNTSTIFDITVGSGDDAQSIVNINSDGDASFSGAITTSSLTISSGASVSGLSYTSLSDYDDLALSENVPKALTDLTGIDDILYKGSVTITDTKEDQTTGIKTSTLTIGNLEYEVVENKDFLIFDRGYGDRDNTNHSNKYVCIEKEGALIADNAVIWGEIHAGAGDIGGVAIGDVVSAVGLTGDNLLVENSSKDGLIIEGAIKETSGLASSSYNESNDILTLVTNNVTSGEIFYRFMTPGLSKQNFYTLAKDKKYILSGEIKVTQDAGTMNSVKIRSENIYIEDTNSDLWYGGIRTPVVEGVSEKWTKFSEEIEIDEEATGFYFSFEVMYESSFKGTIEIKNLQLKEKNLSGVSLAMDNAVMRYLSGGNNTRLTKDYVISPYIGGGYLNISDATTGVQVIIDPGNKTGNDVAFAIKKNNESVIGLGDNGGAYFKGYVDATGGYFKNISFGEGVRNLFGINGGLVIDGAGAATYDKNVFGGYPTNLILPIPSWTGMETSVQQNELNKTYTLRLETAILSGQYGMPDTADWYYPYVGGGKTKKIEYYFGNRTEIESSSVEKNPNKQSGQLIAGGFYSGQTYKLSGKISVQHASWLNFPVLKSEWQNSLATNSTSNFKGIKLTCVIIGEQSFDHPTMTINDNGMFEDGDAIDRRNGSFSHNKFLSFDFSFTIPAEAKGAYLKLEVLKDGDDKPYAGEILLKDLSIIDNDDFSGQISKDVGFVAWSGEQIEENKIFQLDKSGLYIKTERGEIGGWTIQGSGLYSKSEDNSIQLSINSDQTGEIIKIVNTKLTKTFDAVGTCREAVDSDFNSYTYKRPVWGVSSIWPNNDADGSPAPVLIKQIVLNSARSGVTIEQVNGKNIKDLADSTKDGNRITYTFKNPEEFTKDTKIVYGGNPSEQTDLILTAKIQVTGDVFHVSGTGEVYANDLKLLNYSLVNKISELEQRIAELEKN